MNEHDDDPRLRDAFDRLRADARSVSADDALRRLRPEPRAPWGPLLIGAAALVLVVVGLVAFRGDDDGPDVVASDGTDRSDPVDGDDLPSDPLSAEILDGTSWTLANGSSPDGVMPVLVGWPVTAGFSFAPDGSPTISGRAACNGYGSTYALGPDGSFSIGGIGHDDAGCEPNVTASQAAFFDVIARVDHVVLRGDKLIFSGPDAEMLFVRDPSVPIDEIVGRTWRLETLVQGDVETPAGGEPAFLRLDPDGTLSGGTGCRSLTGEWGAGLSQIFFPSFGADGDCPADLVEQDGLVVTVLGDGFTPVVDDDVLRLISVGDEGLVYRLAEPDEAAEPADPADLDPGDALPPSTVAELLDHRPDTWVEVVGFLDDRGGGVYLCDAPIDPAGFCGARYLVLVGDVPADPPSTAVTLRGALDEWSRFVIDPNAPLGELAPDVFEGYAGTPADGAMSAALLAGDLSDPALTWHPDGVVLALGGTQLEVVRTPAEIADPATWRLELDAFRGRVGPFSAVDLLTGADEVIVNNGAHAHCAAPPMSLPAVAFDRQLVIRPDGIDSCLQWFVVDVLIDGDGYIVAVNLDLWEP